MKLKKQLNKYISINSSYKELIRLVLFKKQSVLFLFYKIFISRQKGDIMIKRRGNSFEC